MDKIIPRDPIMNLALKRQMMPEQVRCVVNKAEQIIGYGPEITGRRIAQLKGKDCDQAEQLELELLKEYLE